MKKYLFIALAALGFAACAEKMDDNSPVQKGELEESYIAINLMAADVDTRAVTDDIGNADEYGYELGTDAERKINSAYFFFFNEDGDPFLVTPHQDGGAQGPAQTGNNYLPLNISDGSTSNMDNVSDIRNAVLVLNTYKGVYPSKIVAVLNWTPTGNSYSLSALHEQLADLVGVGGGFVMSNSVYMDGANEVVDAVPLTAANIKTTPEAAKAAPVDIYVERTAAKVVLTATGKVETTDNIFTTQKTSDLLGSNNGTLAGATNNVPVYVKLHGWELYNEYSTSTLLKNIENWNVTTLGLTWNDIPYYRCYWAQSQGTLPSDSFAWSYADAAVKGFPTTNGFKVAVDATYASGTYTYCGENTNQKDASTDPRTKVILKGQLMQKNGENYEPLELASWYGTEYAGNEALRIAVANSLKYILYYKDGDSYTSIKPEDIACVAGNSVGAQAYEVGFQLSNTGQGKIWYQYSSADGYKVFGDTGVAGDNAAKANAYLMGVEPALLYASGQTYYIVDIKHLGKTDTPSEYGIVRNHVYQIDIESITGYGSPVYNGFSNLENPEYPEVSESSYVAARINVLSWKVVKQSVDIVQ